MLARVQLCKSHLDVAFVINNLGAWLLSFLFTPSALPEDPSILFIGSQTASNLYLDHWLINCAYPE